MGLPKGSYWVPSGTVAYKVITLTGSIVVRERSATINILASAGVTISDQRAYTFSWNSDTASGAGKRMGTLALDDNLFGSMKRTSVEPVLYDEEKQTLTVNAAWQGRWLGFNLYVPLTVVLVRDAESSEDKHEGSWQPSMLNNTAAEEAPTICANIRDETIFRGTTIYNIEVHCPVRKAAIWRRRNQHGLRCDNWIVQKRYTHFRDLWLELNDFVDENDSCYPQAITATASSRHPRNNIDAPFPGRLIFNSTTNLQRRRRLLRTWLESAVRSAPSLHPALLEFLELEVVELPLYHRESTDVSAASVCSTKAEALLGNDRKLKRDDGTQGKSIWWQLAVVFIFVAAAVGANISYDFERACLWASTSQPSPRGMPATPSPNPVCANNLRLADQI